MLIQRGEGDGRANSKEKTLISVLLSLSSGNPAIQFLYRYPQVSLTNVLT